MSSSIIRYGRYVRAHLKTISRIGQPATLSRSFSQLALLHTVKKSPLHLHSENQSSAFNSKRCNSRSFSSLPSHELVGLPALSPTMEQGTISSWLKNEGESFEAGDVICQVETDKATVDFEAQDEGVIAKIIVQPGTEVKVGDPIMVVVEDEGDIGAFASFTPEVGAAAPAPAAAPEPTPEPSAPPAPAAAPATPAPAPAGVSSGDRIFASPLARKLAREKDFDIAAIPGTGPGGRVVAADVESFVPEAAPAAAEISAPEVAAAAQPVDGGAYIDFPVTEDAMALAAKFAETKKEVPHYYLTIDLKLDNLLQARAELNEYIGDGDLSLNDMFMKAAALTMRDVPDVNSSWMGTFVRQYKTVDINVLINTDGGVVAPCIKGVEGKGLGEISGMVKCKAVGVEQGSLPKEDYQVGTFSIANLGSYGVKSFSPIVNSPQACMLAIGTAETRIIPNEDPDSEEIYQEAVMLTATLSCDHRVVDGAVGAQWLASFKKYVENPMSMLL
mmetsp:Transcript_16942/g.22014  ORF Transcript_16942/g.22014 Transcript_16942/m.22014 type:complete len:502 (+) Transcript_16942:118-1623(+)